MAKNKVEYDKELLLHLYDQMSKAREFDLEVSRMVKKGMVPGMTHLSVGEEAASIGALATINKDDLITSYHRGHAQVIGKGIDLNGMMAEIMGRANGTCKGKGGSMHIADVESGNLGANGIVGGGMAIAAGAALTQKYLNTGKIVICFFGDGATNEGAFHEALNLAAVWNLPVIFYSINNGYGISTPIKSVSKVEHLYERAAAYGMPGYFIEDGNDVLAVYETFQKVVKDVREGKGPAFIESVTYRWFGHSSSDPGKYRTKEEVAGWKLKDPLLKLSNYILSHNIATEEELKEIEEKNIKAVQEAVEFAKNSPLPDLSSAFEDIYAD